MSFTCELGGVLTYLKSQKVKCVIWLGRRRGELVKKSIVKCVVCCECGILVGIKDVLLAILGLAYPFLRPIT